MQRADWINYRRLLREGRLPRVRRADRTKRADRTGYTRQRTGEQTGPDTHKNTSVPLVCPGTWYRHVHTRGDRAVTATLVRLGTGLPLSSYDVLVTTNLPDASNPGVGATKYGRGPAHETPFTQSGVGATKYGQGPAHETPFTQFGPGTAHETRLNGGCEVWQRPCP